MSLKNRAVTMFKFLNNIAILALVILSTQTVNASVVRAAARPVMQTLAKASTVVGKQVKTYPYLAGIVAATAATAAYVKHQHGKYARLVKKLNKQHAARKGLIHVNGTSYWVALQRFIDRFEDNPNKEDGFRDAIKQNPLIAIQLASSTGLLIGLMQYTLVPPISYGLGKLANSPTMMKNAEDYAHTMLKINSPLMGIAIATTIAASLNIWLTERDRAFRNDDNLLTPEEEQDLIEAQAAEIAAQEAAEAQAPLRDYYEELGVAKDATEQQIKNAYRTQAKALHPDRNVGSERVAAAKFKRLNDAYNILSNPRHRAFYDIYEFDDQDQITSNLLLLQ